MVSWQLWKATSTVSSRYVDKGDFIGRAAPLAGKPAQRSVTVKIPTDGKSLIGGESLYRCRRLVGRILYWSYSYTFGHDLGIALLTGLTNATASQLAASDFLFA